MFEFLCEVAFFTETVDINVFQFFSILIIKTMHVIISFKIETWLSSLLTYSNLMAIGKFLQKIITEQVDRQTL